MHLWNVTKKNMVASFLRIFWLVWFREGNSIVSALHVYTLQGSKHTTWSSGASGSIASTVCPRHATTCNYMHHTCIQVTSQPHTPIESITHVFFACSRISSLCQEQVTFQKPQSKELQRGLKVWDYSGNVLVKFCSLFYYCNMG